MKINILALASLFDIITFSEAFEVINDCPAIPDIPFVQTTKLPNPFQFQDGTNVTTKSQWACRRKEIRNLFSNFGYGPLPPALPRSDISAAFIPGSANNGTIRISIFSSPKTVSFAPRITFPEERNGSKSFPVVIAYGVPIIPIPSNAATIIYNPDDIGRITGMRGTGKFFELYPSYRSSTGGFAAGAWGLSRIIDALELLNAEINIDPTKVVITGCSRYGQAVLAAGALEERVALTIPIESGEGGDACWRIVNNENQKGGRVRICDRVVECPPDWTPFSPNLEKYMYHKVDELPFDQHFLAALIAPRGLLVLSNDIAFLYPAASLGCMNAARTVYDSLGAKGNIGWSLQGGHAHCNFPVAQKGELDAFFARFLGNEEGSLDVWRSDPEKIIDLQQWVNWQIPNLG